MNIKTLLTLCVLSTFLSLGTAHGALIDKGDFSTDSTTGLDWLKLSRVNGLSYAQVSAGAGGYTSSGWRFANATEVVNLFSSNIGIGIGSYISNTTSASGPEYFTGAEEVVVKLGMNLAFNDDRASYNLLVYPDLHQVSLLGFIDVGTEYPGLGEVTAVYTGAFYGQADPFGRWFAGDLGSAYSPDLHGPNFSSFLVRTSSTSSEVPEPATIAMLGLGLFGFAMRRKARHPLAAS